MAKDVFISYSRRDKDFVETLDKALKHSKYKTWLDWQDIEPTAAWWKKIETGIEETHAFIFVISPDSVDSKVCRQEIDHAAKCHKRLVPIVRRDGFQAEEVHPALAELNWLFFRQSDTFEQTFQSLVETLNTDLDHVKTHTRIGVKALEWRRSGEDVSLLLRGSDLKKSKEWLFQASAGKEPKPTELQGKYITVSDQSSTTRQRLLVGGLSSLLFMTAGLAVIAFVQFIGQTVPVHKPPFIVKN